MGASSAENSQYSRESLYNGVFMFSFYFFSFFFPSPFNLILVERRTAGLLFLWVICNQVFLLIEGFIFFSLFSFLSFLFFFLLLLLSSLFGAREGGQRVHARRRYIGATFLTSVDIVMVPHLGMFRIEEYGIASDLNCSWIKVDYMVTSDKM